MTTSTDHQMVEEWLRSYLALRFSTTQAKVDLNHKLKDWGIIDEAHLAELVGEFNRACCSKDEWRTVQIAPPAIIAKAPILIRELIETIVGLFTNVEHRFEVENFIKQHLSDLGDIVKWLLAEAKERTHSQVNLDSKVKDIWEGDAQNLRTAFEDACGRPIDINMDELGGLLANATTRLSDLAHYLTKYL